jgi:hypothetical protein
MRQLHAQLRERADVVIYDSPPFLASADAQVLSADVDGVLYVVQFGEVRKSAIRHAVDLLSQAHANLLGIVFNKITLSGIRDDYYYYGYYRYYRYYDYRPKIEGAPSQRRRRGRHADYEAMLAAREAHEQGNGQATPETEAGPDTDGHAGSDGNAETEGGTSGAGGEESTAIVPDEEKEQNG